LITPDDVVAVLQGKIVPDLEARPVGLNDLQAELETRSLRAHKPYRNWKPGRCIRCPREAIDGQSLVFLCDLHGGGVATAELRKPRKKSPGNHPPAQSELL